VVRPIPAEFAPPPQDAAIDLAATLRAVPDTATIAGMFPDALAQAARRAGTKLPSARDRFVAFNFYPLREHVQLLGEASERLFVGVPLRRSLRKLGRRTPEILHSTVLGRVTLGAAEGVHAAIAAMANTYAINLRPSHAEVIETGPHHAVVRLRSIHFMLDSLHVGVFEGTMRFAGARGEVRICAYGPSEADLLCKWEDEPAPSE
jgi:uncharacterized protein (TIGR02265 family)